MFDIQTKVVARDHYSKDDTRSECLVPVILLSATLVSCTVILVAFV